MQDASAIDEDSNKQSTLVSRNITVLGRRTSVRLEPEMWRALRDISIRERCTIHDLCSLISLRKNPNTSLTAAIRVFLMLYYRASSTEEGHQRAGHGSFESMKTRAGLPRNWDAVKTKRTGNSFFNGSEARDAQPSH
jgi:predicted DNA-binding ribbon-helix-helix protein